MNIWRELLLDRKKKIKELDWLYNRRIEVMTKKIRWKTAYLLITQEVLKNGFEVQNMFAQMAQKTIKGENPD